MFIYREQEMRFIARLLARGYGWVYGIHGIGKTTLVKKCIDDGLVNGYDIRYIDARTDVHAFPNLTCSLLNAFGYEYSGDDHKNHRLLKSIFYDASSRKIRIVIDELDVYSPASVKPVWYLAESESPQVGVLFISAHEVEFFRESDDRSSAPTPISDIEICPLSSEDTHFFFVEAGIPSSAIDSFVKMSGGNPTLMTLLSEMCQTSQDINLFSKANRHSLAAIFSYFNTLWKALEGPVKVYSLITTILLSTRTLNKEYWLKFKTNSYYSPLHIPRKLTAMFSYGDFLPYDIDAAEGLPALISPLFMTWLLTEKTPVGGLNFIAEYGDSISVSVVSDKVLGISLSFLEEAAAAITSRKDMGAILQDLVASFK